MGVVFFPSLPFMGVLLFPSFVIENASGGSGALFVKPEKNSIFLKKSKTVISVENRKFSRSRMTKRTAPLNSSREI